ncbi:hypothetical protein O1L55_40930 [Streptomyces albulus]|nr:hypothetical protein [Streptomyces noursei]
METRTEIGEGANLSSWLAAATHDATTSIDLWHQNPHLPRRILSGITFDIVLAKQRLVELAYEILHRYEQPLGPAVAFANLSYAAVLVPRGTDGRWKALMATSHWSQHPPRPTCLGPGHAIRVPALLPQPGDTTTRWLKPPDEDLSIGRAPLLTSPAPLARCLTEARILLAPDTEPTTLRRAVSAVRSALRSPRGRDDDDCRTDTHHSRPS